MSNRGGPPDDDDDLWVIILKPLPHAVPARVRVRQLLKRALRDYQLRCRGVRYPTPEELEAIDEDAGVE